MRHSLIIYIVAAVVLASCASKANLPKTEALSGAAELVARATPTSVPDNITARCTYDIGSLSKGIPLGGTLKMKRDQLIQLSITAIGMEVVRMEFTPDCITIIDRVNKRYIQDSYDAVEFARENHLDFHVAQALFWGELFTLDGEPLAASRFTLVDTGGRPVLTTGNGLLAVNFVTTSDGVLRQTNISSVRDVNKSLNMQYTAHQDRRPTEFVLYTNGMIENLRVGFSLSNVKVNTNTAITPTTVSSNYKRLSAQTAISSLLGK